MTAALDSPPQAAAVDLGRHLARFDADALVRSSDYRHAVSRVDPLVFALIYLPQHLRGDETGGQITFRSSTSTSSSSPNAGSGRTRYQRSTVTRTLTLVERGQPTDYQRE